MKNAKDLRTIGDKRSNDVRKGRGDSTRSAKGQMS
jgi:hypothetical protein